MGQVYGDVILASRAHNKYWRTRDDYFWLCRLMEEVGELSAALAGDHSDSPEHELEQVAGIAINWLQKRTGKSAYQSVLDAEAERDALKKENAELREQLRWKKWPEEKPALPVSKDNEYEVILQDGTLRRVQYAWTLRRFYGFGEEGVIYWRRFIGPEE